MTTIHWSLSCELATIIHTGSANRHDVCNPFIRDKTADMLRKHWHDWDNFVLIPIYECGFLIPHRTMKSSKTAEKADALASE